MTIIDRPSVVIGGDQAPAVAAALRLLASSNGGLPERTLQLLRECEQLTAALRPLPGSAVVEVPRDVPRRNLKDVGWMGAAAAASDIRCTDRNVRDLCTRGVLGAERVAGRWLIDPASVAEYVRSTK